MGEHAQASHTTVSILGIEGGQCAMDILSSCAAITNGTVSILHPFGNGQTDQTDSSKSDSCN